jgi:mono/diheme cytochrome c family protein
MRRLIFHAKKFSLSSFTKTKSHMKKLTLFLCLAAVGQLQFCSSSKNAASGSSAKVSYARNVQPIVQQNCSPCHIPPQGRAKALNSYDAAKSNADDIIAAIKKNPGEKGFMPMRHPKLPDSTIAVFEKWKEAGFAE